MVHVMKAMTIIVNGTPHEWPRARSPTRRSLRSMCQTMHSILKSPTR